MRNQTHKAGYPLGAIVGRLAEATSYWEQWVSDPPYNLWRNGYELTEIIALPVGSDILDDYIRIDKLRNRQWSLVPRKSQIESGGLDPPF